jgi:putative PEP-CTERM system histidine kinase
MDILLTSLTADISFAAAAISILLAIVVVLKDGRLFAHRSFAAAMALLGLVELLRGLSCGAVMPRDIVFWQKLIFVFSAPIPGTWLLFSLSFARADYRDFLRKWKWSVASVFAIPGLIVTVFANFIFIGVPIQTAPLTWLHPLGQSGKAYYLFLLIATGFILTNLERTLRASIGRIRWQIKFMVLGLGGLCAVWIYISSQALLYSALDTRLGIVNPVALLGASLLFSWSLARSEFMNVDVYLSRRTIHYSLTIILAGTYLVSVGLLAQWLRYFNPGRPLPLDALFVLLALMGMGILIFSDRLQERLKRVVTRHFRRPMYDYRREWMELTARTNSIADIHNLCMAVAKIVSQTFGVLSVNIWLCDETKKRLMLVGSTVFTHQQSQHLERNGRPVSELLLALNDSRTAIDFNERKFDWSEGIMLAQPDYFIDFKMRYALPLETGGELVGMITLNDDRVGKAPLSMEDQDLLHAYAAQVAARVLQLRSAENLRRTQEIEAFQNAAAFFVHDLKNVASRLSLTMQNLPAYFDNPEFRAEALKLIGESVAKIDETCNRLSSMKQNIELEMVQTDLNLLATKVLRDFQSCAKALMEKDLQPLPRIMADPEQLQKVLTNLLMNAHDAVNGQGKIRVETTVDNGQVTISVADTGSGMSQNFIESSLFRPFRSTKKRGMGIGLFHCKMIVEAHHGRIEVVSQEGKGSVFRVILPVHQ